MVSDQARLPVHHDEHEDDSTPVLAFWQYLGSGYLNPGDVASRPRYGPLGRALLELRPRRRTQNSFPAK